MLSYFNHLFVQDERSMKLLNEFGITNVTVTGDTRFDRVLDVCKQARELPFIERFLESKEGKRPIVSGRPASHGLKTRRSLSLISMSIRR